MPLFGLQASDLLLAVSSVHTKTSVQLFESVSIVASPGSPGSKPLNMFDLSRTEADLRVAMETAEEQAAVSTQPAKHGLREYTPMDHPVKDRSVKFNEDSMRNETIYEAGYEADPYGPPQLSESLRQASIASCASEWVDALKQSPGSSRKR